MASRTYPGTINVDEAQTITVGLADVANASFALVPQRMTRISGVVRNSQGKPFAANLSLRTQSGGGMSMRGLAMSGPDGRFSAANVPPGEHSIEISPRPGEDESASVPITAGGQDITDLIITTTPGATISGQIIFDGAASVDTTLRVSASSPDPGGPGPMRIYDNTQGVVDDKGRFQIRGLYGPCDVQRLSSRRRCQERRAGSSSPSPSTARTSPTFRSTYLPSPTAARSRSS